MKVLKFLCSLIIKPICFILDKIIYRVKITGLENLPKNEACIICGNHIHAMDAPALVAAMPTRKIGFMAKEELWKTPGFGFMAWIFGVFPVARGKRDAGAIKTSMEILNSGRILGIYPEGTRNGMDRGIKPKNGAVNIAIKKDVPIIPFGVSGTFKPFSKNVYKFGKPIYLSEYKDKAKEKEVADELTQKVMNEVMKLRDEIKA